MPPRVVKKVKRELRFATDAKVLCLMGDHPVCDWHPGRVLKLESARPMGTGPHVYTVLLHNGGLAFAPADDDECIRSRPAPGGATVMSFQSTAKAFGDEGTPFILLPYEDWDAALDRDKHIQAIPEHLFEFRGSGGAVSLEGLTECPQCAFQGPGAAGETKFYRCGQKFPGLEQKRSHMPPSEPCRHPTSGAVLCENCCVWCKECLRAMCMGCDNFTMRGKCEDCVEEDDGEGGDY